MRMNRAVSFLVISLSMMATPLSVRAAGLITALTASANPVNVNTDVTFTVKGTSGGCGDLTIDYGDGQSIQLTSVSFNNNTNTTTPAHKYAVAKTYLVKATPGKSCSGTATVSLAVTGGGSGGGGAATGGFAQLANRNSLANVARLFAPQIDSVFPFSSIRPGGGVIVMGSSFGPQPGKFRLKLQSGLVTDLTGLEWGGKAIGGTIDPGISGVVDQPATLQIVRANGQISNEVPVTFTARREVQWLPMESVRFSCASGSDTNKCNEWQAGADMGPHSFQAYHACTGIFLSCHDSGKDVYSATLANGWKLSTVSIGVGKSRADPPVILRDDPGSFEMSIYWDTTGNKSVNYRGWIYVEGPAGTNFR